MKSHEQRCPSPLRAVNVTLGIALTLLWPLGAAAATGVGAPPTGTPSTATAARLAPPGPQLSIAIDDGHTSAAVGDKPTYTTTISNLGTTRVPGLVVTQSIPTGLTFKSADSAGQAKAGVVSWRLNLTASGKATLHTTMTVTPTPKELLRLATVACASVSAKGPPVVCATDSDQLPAGATAQAVKTKAATGSGATATSTGRNGWYLAGLGAIALVIGSTTALMLRRRKIQQTG